MWCETGSWHFSLPLMKLALFPLRFPIPETEHNLHCTLHICLTSFRLCRLCRLMVFCNLSMSYSEQVNYGDFNFILGEWRWCHLQIRSIKANIYFRLGHLSSLWPSNLPSLPCSFKPSFLQPFNHPLPLVIPALIHIFLCPSIHPSIHPFFLTLVHPFDLLRFHPFLGPSNLSSLTPSILPYGLGLFNFPSLYSFYLK